MKIVHLSYALSSYHDPLKWLQRIKFFTGILDQLALKAETMSVHLIQHEGTLNRTSVEYHFLKTNAFGVWFPFRVHSYVKGLRPDIIIVHGLIYPWQILWLRFQLGERVKIFAQHHAERPLKFYKARLQVLADKMITGYFFTALPMAQLWIDAGQIRDSRKVHEAMEVSSSFYVIDKLVARNKKNISGDPIYLWVGRLDENKDPIVLLKAFENFASKNPFVRLYVVFQSDELIDDVKALAVRIGNQIELVGRVEHDDLLDWYNAADFIISTSHYEGSGVAVCEAMSCGCIPLLTNIPSFNVMSGNGRCGKLFIPGDVSSLLTALEASLKMDRDLERHKTLKQFKSKLSFKAIADTIYDVVESSL